MNTEKSAIQPFADGGRETSFSSLFEFTRRPSFASVRHAVLCIESAAQQPTAMITKEARMRQFTNNPYDNVRVAHTQSQFP